MTSSFQVAIFFFLLHICIIASLYVAGKEELFIISQKQYTFYTGKAHYFNNSIQFCIQCVWSGIYLLTRACI